MDTNKLIIKILRFSVVLFIFGLLMNYWFGREYSLVYTAGRAIVIAAIYIVCETAYHNFKANRTNNL